MQNNLVHVNAYECLFPKYDNCMPCAFSRNRDIFYLSNQQPLVIVAASRETNDWYVAKTS